MRLKAFLLLLIILPNLVSAQRWKRQRYEWVTGVGATQFLGDVGGRDQIGSDFFFDLDAASTRYMVNLGMRYKISQYVSAKTGFSFGEIAGNDKFTKEPFRQNRNIHFRSPVVEWATQIEVSWMRESTGSRYKIRRVRGRGRKGSQVYVYGFAGVALLYMNPMAQVAGQGKWHSLRPLHTEGQEFVPSRKEYSNWQFAIPFGVGMKYAIDKKSSIGLEYGLRKTFTDYIDDVSTSYVYTKEGEVRGLYSATTLAQWDNVSRALADPSLNRVSGNADSFPEACSACPGQQRGDPSDLDSYMFMMITYQRKISTTRKGLPKF